MKIEQGYTKAQMTWLMMLRLFIGWHFMYEGLVKIMNPKWTSLPYLLDSKGPAASFFIKLVLVQFVSAHSGPASSCMKNSLPGMVGMRLEVTAFVGP